MMRLQVRLSPWLLCAFSFWGAQAQSQTPLPPHPDIVAGQFDNGLKYIAQSRGSGGSRVALYLHVKTGSLNEGQDQSGLAHFVTHMGFAGSKHFVSGQIVSRLRALGDRQPGPHKNAVVNFHETVYRLGGHPISSIRPRLVSRFIDMGNSVFRITQQNLAVSASTTIWN